MKTYLYYSLVIVFILFTSKLSAQLPIVETNFNWQNCTNGYFNGGLTEINNSFYVLSANNGDDTSAVGYHDDWDLMLIKTDSFGNVIWKKCFGGSKRDTPYSLQKTEDGNIYLIGFTWSDDGDIKSRRWNGPQIWAIKVDTNGNILWEKTFGVETGTGFDIRGTMPMPDGGIIVSAKIQGKSGDVSAFYGHINIWLVRFSADGEMLWEKTYGNDGMWENLLSMCLTEDGNIMCAASVSKEGGMVDCSLPSYEVYNAWLYEIDLQGNILWENCYGGTGDDLPSSITQTECGFAIASSSESWDGDIVNQHGSSDVWVFGINPNGNLLWSNCLGGRGYEFPLEIFSLSDGGYMVVSYTYSVDGDVSSGEVTPTVKKLWFVKVNSQGIGQWQRVIYSRRHFERADHPSIIKKTDNIYVVAQGIEARGPDIICNGNPSDDNPYVWLFEVEFTDQFVSVSELHGQGLNVSPNPANNLMMFELPAIGELCIYSVSGHLLHKAQCLAGDYHYNCGHLSPGVYFYTFMTDGALLHGKVVVE